jgi:sulfur-carrier protein
MAQVEVRLFANLQKFFPEVRNGESMLVTLEDAATLDELITYLNIPREKINMIIVNGKHEKEDYILKQGDRVGIFPLIAGG